VQDRLELVFTTFLRKRSASKVLEFLNAHELFLPRRDRFGDLVWKRPTVAAILQILKNPAYAGAARLRAHAHGARRSGISPR
jgi:Recombinase